MVQNSLVSRYGPALLLLLSFFGCNPKPDIAMIAHSVHMDPFMARKLEAEILDGRRQKDMGFKSSPDSPVPVAIRSQFKGLEYYPIDWKYRFEGPVNSYPNPQRFKMITTTGDQRDAIKYGYIQFDLEGKQFKLQVYRLVESAEKNVLFIPFVDANVGKETYPAGRYIDLIEKPNRLYVIDFNTSYNPSCAYGGDYDCPVTPKENHLPVPIPAGEKILSIAPKPKKEFVERASPPAGSNVGTTAPRT